MNKLRIAAVLWMVFLLSACAKPESQKVSTPGTSPEINEKKIASVNVVKATPMAVELAAGGSAPLVVKLNIQSGYHINANPPTFPYLKATQLDIASADGISAAAISYPAPLNRKFTFADKELAIYEGDTELKTILKADQSAAPGERSLLAQLRVQACDDQVCYPPGQIELKIPVTVK